MAATVTINIKVNSGKAQNTFGKLKEQIQDMAKAINNDASKAIKSFDKEMALLTRGVDNVGTSIHELGGKIDASGAKMTRIGASSRKIGIDITNIGNSASTAAPKVTSFFQNIMSSTAGVLSANVLTNIAGKLKDVTGVFQSADLEEALIDFESVAGRAMKSFGTDLDDIKMKAKLLGAETRYSSLDAVTAMTELLKGGVNLKSIMSDATDATLNLASATKLQLTPAAEIMSKQLATWGDTGLSATQVADTLAKAVNASVLNMDGLALGLANASGTARTTGVSFEELNTTLAMISGGFGSGSDAGTSFKAFLSRLVPSTANASSAMAKLGLMSFSTQKALQILKMHGVKPTGKTTQELSTQLYNLSQRLFKTKKQQQDFLDGFYHSGFFSAEGKFLGMEHAVGLLNKQLKGVSEMEKLELLNEIFGQDAIRAADILARQGTEGWKATIQAMNEAGSAAQQAEDKDKGFNAALDSMKGSFTSLQETIGDVFRPTLTSLMNNTITPAINVINNMVMALQGSDEAFNKLSNDLQRVVVAVGSVKTAFGEQGLAGAISVASYWLDPFVQQFKTKINELVTTVVNRISTAAPQLMDAFIAWRQEATLWILRSIPDLTTGLFVVLDTIGAFIQTNVPIVASMAARWAEAFLQWIGPATAMLIIQLGEMLGHIYLYLLQRSPEIVAAITQWTKDAAAWFLAVGLPLLLEAIGTVMLAIIGKIVFAFQNAFSNGSLGKYIIDSIIDGVGAGFGRVTSYLAGRFSGNLFNPGRIMGTGIEPRAGGGSVTGGRSYLVGELGPEIFTPKSSGSIIPNSKIAGKSAPIVNISIHNPVVDNAQRLNDLLNGLENKMMNALSSGVDQFVLGGST